MLEADLYKKIASDMGISVDRVKAYDKHYWKHVKLDLNNPTFDVLEIPFLGSFTITPAKLRSTLKVNLNDLKRLRNKIRKSEEISPNLLRIFEDEKKLFKALWNLRKFVKFEGGKYKNKKLKKWDS